jgi:hypothetical protein
MRENERERGGPVRDRSVHHITLAIIRRTHRAISHHITLRVCWTMQAQYDGVMLCIAMMQCKMSHFLYGSTKYQCEILHHLASYRTCNDSTNDMAVMRHIIRISVVTESIHTYIHTYIYIYNILQYHTTSRPHHTPISWALLDFVAHPAQYIHYHIEIVLSCIIFYSILLQYIFLCTFLVLAAHPAPVAAHLHRGRVLHIKLHHLTSYYVRLYHIIYIIVPGPRRSSGPSRGTPSSSPHAPSASPHTCPPIGPHQKFDHSWHLTTSVIGDSTTLVTRDLTITGI